MNDNRIDTLKFTLLADLHYKKGMYISSVEDVNEMMESAHATGADFVMHVGDFCNDYGKSPEIVKAYLNNRYDLPAYGIYGNHELESAGNSMEKITPMLCNREVTWGTEDGKIGDGTVGYFYFDKNGFRVICLDSNYSMNPTTGEWEHNRTASWGAPAGNQRINSLADVQLKWLEKVLMDAAEQGLRCIIFSHTGFSGEWESTPDWKEVQALFRRANAQRKGTVLLAASGHLHTDHLKVIEDVVHFDVNTVRNGLWLPTPDEGHYNGITFPYTEYDENGDPVRTYNCALNDAWMSKNTWFFAKPLYATVTVTSEGEVVIEGCSSDWYADVAPDEKYHVNPKISSGSFRLG